MSHGETLWRVFDWVVIVLGDGIELAIVVGERNWRKDNECKLYTTR